MQKDLTQGSITKTLLLFAMPMIAGDLLQQFYNIADTLIVGRFLGAEALAAVGSSYTLMTFLTSILLGLSMGSGAVFSIHYGEKNEEKLKESMAAAFWLIFAVALALNIFVFLCIHPIMSFLQVPEEIYDMMQEYLWIVFWGIFASFLYNYFASLLRAVGNSVVPLVFLAISAVLNILLQWDKTAVFSWHWKIYAPEMGNDEGNRTIFFSDLFAAVGNELGNSHGAGTCKQLWNGNYGGFCGGCEN